MLVQLDKLLADAEAYQNGGGDGREGGGGHGGDGGRGVLIDVAMRLHLTQLAPRTARRLQVTPN